MKEMTIGEFLLRNKMTQTALAARLQISTGHLCEICNGRKRPGRRLAAAIEVATGGAVSRLALLYPEDVASQVAIKEPAAPEKEEA